jgi:hypothetical protein
MHKRTRLLLVCLLSLSTALACGQAAKPEPTAAPEPTAVPRIVSPEPTRVLEPTATPQPTAVPQPTATSEPTAIPEPTATPLPAATAIPGWEKFEARGVALWLPESYEGGNLEEDIDVIVGGLRGLGPDFEQMAQIIEQNPTLYVIWAFDSKVGDSGFLTNVTVTTEKVFSAMTIDTYLDAAVGQLPAQFQVVERDTVSLNGRQAGRLGIEFSISGVVGQEVMYVIKDDSTMWVITYATGAAEFEQRLPVFEQSASTFTIQP